MTIRKKNIIVASVLALTVVLVLAVMIGQPRKFAWDPDRAYHTSGVQPYDLQLFDELMSRSLDNGYTVFYRNAAPRYEEMDAYLDNLRNTPVDTSLLVIVGSAFNCRNEIRTMLDHASRGGCGVLVSWNGDLDSIQSRVYGVLDIPVYADEVIDIDGSGYVTYSREWLASRPDTIVPLLTAQGDTVKASSRYLTSYVYMHPDDSYMPSHPPVSDYIPVTDIQGRRCKLMFDLVRADTDESCLADIYYPATGGHLYIVALPMYFCNLGVRLPEGPAIIANVMDRVDHRPVKRWHKVFPDLHRSTQDSEDGWPLMTWIYGHPALSLAWALTLAGVLLWLARGLVRRYPVARGAEIDQLDKTDAVAVREYQFRHSPLQHFLFQCSWLYRNSKDYTELYEIDFRRLSRVVSRITGIDLRAASEHDLRTMADTLAPTLHRDAAEILSELQWIREVHRSVDPVSKKQYRYMHSVVETYPFN